MIRFYFISEFTWCKCKLKLGDTEQEQLELSIPHASMLHLFCVMRLLLGEQMGKQFKIKSVIIA